MSSDESDGNYLGVLNAAVFFWLAQKLMILPKKDTNLQTSVVSDKVQI